MSDPIDNQEIEARELAVRGLHTCALCGRPSAPADRSACEKCLPRTKADDLGRANAQLRARVEQLQREVFMLQESCAEHVERINDMGDLLTACRAYFRRVCPNTTTLTELKLKDWLEAGDDE